MFRIASSILSADFAYRAEAQAIKPHGSFHQDAA